MRDLKSYLWLFQAYRKTKGIVGALQEAYRVIRIARQVRATVRRLEAYKGGTYGKLQDRPKDLQ